MNELPRIELPTSVVPPEWARTVELLIERATVVEAWADECRQRAALAMSVNETAVLMLNELLNAGRVKEATEAAQAAADEIQSRRARMN